MSVSFDLVTNTPSEKSRRANPIALPLRPSQRNEGVRPLSCYGNALCRKGRSTQTLSFDGWTTCTWTVVAETPWKSTWLLIAIDALPNACRRNVERLTQARFPSMKSLSSAPEYNYSNRQIKRIPSKLPRL